MTNSGVNDTDPRQDDDFQRIDFPRKADPSLPTPPDQEELPERGEQPEPEQVEMP
jgi:hypothetical protein